MFPLPQTVSGHLVRRYKRFLADVELEDGTGVTAHCPNSGSMLGMRQPGSPVRLLHVPDPRRKLEWTWELVSPDGRTWVGCNTQRPNQVAAWAAAAGLIPGVDAGEVRREVLYGQNSRVDLMVGDHHIEVKNTTMARCADPICGAGGQPGQDLEMPHADPRPRGDAALDGGLDIPSGVAMFPDTVTVRGAKHMRELAVVAESGKPATVLFFVNRGDCDRFAVARHIDPAYAEAFDAAVDAGVEMVPLGMDVSPEGWRVRGPLPIVG